MLRWAFRANFANCSRFAKKEISFQDMTVEKAENEMKSVTYVHAQSVTYVLARCREGDRDVRTAWIGLKGGHQTAKRFEF
jgi:uncharacterized membrane protein